MIKAGAFDQPGHTRRGLVMCHEQAVEDVVAQKKKEDNGEFTDLFAMGGSEDPEAETFSVEVASDVPEWERKDMLAFDEMLASTFRTTCCAGSTTL